MTQPQVLRTYDDVTRIDGNEVRLRQSAGSQFAKSSVVFEGSGNVLYVEDGAMLRDTRLRFCGSGSVIYIRKSTRFTRLVATVFHDSVLYLGPGASFTSPARIVPSERRHVIIGKDAMFASRVAFRTADPHLVYSVDSHQRVNPSASVWVGDHVWLGEDSLFLKGARVGSGSIVAARSVVTRAIPSNSTAAGAPARTVREGLFWTRPSVHAWTAEQSAQAETFEGDQFIFRPDAESVDVDGLEAELNAATTVEQRFEWCRRLDRMPGKNRFAVAAAPE